MTDINTEIARQLGAAIKKSRRNLKLSQTELADLAGVSLNYVSKLESGQPKAQLDKLLDVLTILGLEFSLGPGKSRLVIAKESGSE